MVEVRTAEQLDDLRELLTSGGDVSIAVAYLTRSGFEQIEPPLMDALAKGHKVRLVVDLYSGITEPDTVEKLVALSRNNSNDFNFRAFFGLNPMFHAKLYISRSGESVSFLTGSFNLTGKAIDGNLEHGLYVKGERTEKVCKEALERFEKSWEQAEAPTDDRVKRYRESYRRNLDRLPNPEVWAAARQHSEVNYWLFKCNPSNPEMEFYSFLEFKEDGITTWGDKGSNPVARKRLKDMKIGDGVLFYESGDDRKKIMGLARIVKEADPESSTGRAGPRPIVKIEFVREFEHHVSLDEFKEIRRKNGLSEETGPLTIVIVSPEEWAEIVRMGRGETP